MGNVSGDEKKKPEPLAEPTDSASMMENPNFPVSPVPPSVDDAPPGFITLYDMEGKKAGLWKITSIKIDAEFAEKMRARAIEILESLRKAREARTAAICAKCPQETQTERKCNHDGTYPDPEEEDPMFRICCPEMTMYLDLSGVIESVPPEEVIDFPSVEIVVEERPLYGPCPHGLPATLCPQCSPHPQPPVEEPPVLELPPADEVLGETPDEEDHKPLGEELGDEPKDFLPKK